MALRRRGLAFAAAIAALVGCASGPGHDAHRATGSGPRFAAGGPDADEYGASGIRSVDDAASTYVPALVDTEYGRTSLRHLLQMSSGVRFQENYSGRDDASRLFADTVLQAGAGGVETVKPYNERLRASGRVFSYASAETQMLGLVLRAAVGRPVADYLHEKIWEPMGAEADATWLIDRAGQEATYCCLNAVLRDYARLGLLLAHDGRRGERQLIPEAWVRAATTVAAEDWHLRPYAATRFFGYGYQTWVFPGERRMFALRGVPASKARPPRLTPAGRGHRVPVTR
jgi:CubicO group peptidase (beta-lactamase class C family)